jgi:hypothetical protein
MRSFLVGVGDQCRSVSNSRGELSPADSRAVGGGLQLMVSAEGKGEK